MNPQGKKIDKMTYSSNKGTAIGLFPGSFDPIHKGHITVAHHAMVQGNLDEVWFVLSRQNPLKQKDPLLGDNERYHLLQLALSNKKRMHACKVELSLPTPSYTYRTVCLLKEQHPEVSTFSLIIGQDTVHSYHRWRQAKQLGKEVFFWIYPRFTTPSPPPDEQQPIHPMMKRAQYLSGRFICISSSNIRKSLATGQEKRIKSSLPSSVYESMQHQDASAYRKKRHL